MPDRPLHAVPAAPAPFLADLPRVPTPLILDGDLTGGSRAGEPVTVRMPLDTLLACIGWVDRYQRLRDAVESLPDAPSPADLDAWRARVRAAVQP